MKTELEAAKKRIKNLKKKIHANLITEYVFSDLKLDSDTKKKDTYDSCEVWPDSSTSNVSYPSKAVEHQKNQSLFREINKNKFEKKLNTNKTSSSGFIPASAYIKNLEKNDQFKNTPACEKIIAEAVSNDKISSMNVGQQKFYIIL